MKSVVGAAIVRHGCVLAGRRTSPPEAAGRWEFPGGKVEPNETPSDALVREISEELGCTIEVRHWLDGVAAIGETHELTVATAVITQDEPVATEHDALRWLTPEELGEVDWLEPDRPFLSELRTILLDGERLPGGNVGGAVRVGETVRRPTGPWTPSVHALLGHLADVGLTGVPKVYGIDERGREVLDFLPGEVIDVDAGVLSEPRLIALGQWTRAFHDAVLGFDDDGPWRFFGVQAPQLIAHNDLAPYNVCFAGDEVSGVFDWDLAGPSTPLMELAHIAWNAVPLFRPIETEATARRLQLVTAAYDGPSAGAVLAAVPGRVHLAIQGIRLAADSGDTGMQALMSTGEPERTERRLAVLLERMPDLMEILES